MRLIIIVNENLIVNGKRMKKKDKKIATQILIVLLHKLYRKYKNMHIHTHNHSETHVFFLSLDKRD